MLGSFTGTIVVGIRTAVVCSSIVECLLGWSLGFRGPRRIVLSISKAKVASSLLGAGHSGRAARCFTGYLRQVYELIMIENASVPSSIQAYRLINR